MNKKILKKDTIQLSEALNNWKRAIADYQNLEKRVSEERKERTRAANKELILRLLPVVDTLMSAQNHVQNEGLELAIKQFLTVLAGEGAAKIETEGKMFDPNIMECVNTELGEKGKVLQEVRAGYLLHGRVLRPAQVKVGKEKVEEKEESLAKEQLTKGDYM